MVKSQLIKSIYKKFPQFPKQVIALGVDHVIDDIREALICGRTIEVRGFGAFKSIYCDSRSARNPKTGQKVIASPKYKIHFRSGNKLHNDINQS